MVQEIIKEKDELIEMVETMKKEIATIKGEINKLKKIEDTSPTLLVVGCALFLGTAPSCGGHTILCCHSTGHGFCCGHGWWWAPFLAVM